MESNPLLDLNRFGQSIWYDNISRDNINSGLFEKMIQEDELRGVTSNPSIFQKAISGSTAYDKQIRQILYANPETPVEEIYEQLVVKDIRDVADIFRPVFEDSEGLDGYISLEVSPDLANDTEKTIAEAMCLHKVVNRPNLMIKVPATRAGVPAIRKLISEGLSINVTLMFSMSHYEAVVDAYLSGLEDRLKTGKKINTISSVASFFVSRVDSKVDARLEEKGLQDLMGKTAIANSKMVYQRSLEIYGSERVRKLMQKEARWQRLLWASTSTKNPEYPDILYVEELIGDDTVNTIPPDTLDAYRDHGNPAERLTENIDEAQSVLNQVDKAGIKLNEITETLQTEGVKAFADSYHTLLDALKQKTLELK